MYSTSELYKSALTSGFLDTNITGKITLSNGKIIEFEEKDIVPGTLSFDNKSVNGNDFSFGGIYVGELKVDLFKQIDRYSLNNAKVEISYFLKCDGDVQEIPLGVFYVHEAIRTKKIISLKAYDSMTMFDVYVDENTSGYMYDIITYISEKCGAELAQTEEEINEFLNSDWWLTIDQERIKTYREALSQIGLMCGRFATIDRFGKLVFRSFQTKTADGSISAKIRTESNIKDFSTRFAGIKARFIVNQGFMTYKAFDETIVNGIMLDLGDISIFVGEDESKRIIMDNLLKQISEIEFVPADFSMISDPSIELGDCLSLTDVNNSSASIKTLVHSYTWKYHSTQKIVGYGSDPKLDGVVTQNEKMMAQIESQLSSKNLTVKTYTNSRRMTVGSSEQQVIIFNFATTEKTTVMFMATIPFVSELDGNVILTCYIDGNLDESATIQQYFERGSHTLTFTNYFPMTENGRATLKINMCVGYFESDIRRHDSKISSIMDYIATGILPEPVIDTSIPSITIEKEGIKALLFAQGMAGAGQWDGTLNFVEELNVVPVISRIGIGGLAENIRAEHVPVKNTIIAAQFDEIHSGGIYGIGKISEAVGVQKATKQVNAVEEVLSPIKIGDQKLMLGAVSASINISNTEE